MDGVGKWVEKLNGSQGGYVLKKELGKGHSIFKENMAGTRPEVVTGVFWPLKDFEAHVKRKAKKGEVSVHEGARGVMRNSSHGCPDVCAKIYAYIDRIMGERKEEGDSQNQLRPGQLQSRFSQLIEEQAKASTFKKRTADDGLEVLTRAKKKPALTTVAEEGSDSGKPELEDEEDPESESQNGGQLAQVQKAAGKAKAKAMTKAKGKAKAKGKTRVRSRQKTK